MNTSMDFGKTVKHKLIDIEKNQAWLIEQVKDKTGLYCDNSLMNRIYKGEVRGNVRAAICEILEIEEGPR